MAKQKYTRTQRRHNKRNNKRKNKTRGRRGRSNNKTQVRRRRGGASQVPQALKNREGYGYLRDYTQTRVFQNLIDEKVEKIKEDKEKIRELYQYEPTTDHLVETFIKSLQDVEETEEFIKILEEDLQNKYITQASYVHSSVELDTDIPRMEGLNKMLNAKLRELKKRKRKQENAEEERSKKRWLFG
jgi:GTPase involved in cell partitioning and DNA repair